MSLTNWPARLAALLALAAGACIADGDNRCSSGEDFDMGFCLCEPPRMRDDNGQCVDGSAEDAGATDAGESTLEGFGEACDSNADCASDYNDHCQDAPAGDKYCTHTGCDSNAECPADSYCVDDGSDSLCKRYPTGLAEACESDTDCEGNDATLCTVGAPGGATCVVPGCSDDADCPPGTVCNDFTSLAPDSPVFCGESVL